MKYPWPYPTLAECQEVLRKSWRESAKLAIHNVPPEMTPLPLPPQSQLKDILPKLTNAIFTGNGYTVFGEIIDIHLVKEEKND